MNRKQFLFLISAFLLSRFFIASWPAPGSDIGLYYFVGKDYVAACYSDSNFYDVRGEVVEYPPLSALWMTGPLWLTDNSNQHSSFRTWRIYFKLRYLFFDSLVFFLIIWLVYKKKISVSFFGLGVYIISGLILFNFLYDRMDYWLGLLLTGSLLIVKTRKHWIILILLLSVAISFKLIPLIIAPILLFMTNGLNSKEVFKNYFIRAFALIIFLLLLFLPFYYVWGEGTYAFFDFHSRRGLHMESTFGSVLIMLSFVGLPIRIIHGLGSYNIDSMYSGAISSLSVYLVLVPISLVFLYLFLNFVRRDPWRKVSFEERFQVLLVALILVLSIGIIFSKVFSPQYLCWLVPLFAFLEPSGLNRKASYFFVAACVFTTPIFPYLYYGELINNEITGPDAVLAWGRPTFFSAAVLFLRNMAVIISALYLWLSLKKKVQTFIQISDQTSK